MIRKLAHLWCLCTVLLLTGCLQFDGQEITLRYDKQADRLDMLLVYRGIYDNQRGSDAEPQLDDALAWGSFAFYSNWPLLIEPKEAKAPLNTLLRSVEVENGGFFTSPTGELCAFQFLRIHKLKDFLSQVQALVALGVQRELAQPNAWQPDDETEELLTELFRGRRPLFTVQDSSIVLHVPCSPRGHQELMRLLQSAVADGLTDDLKLRLGHEARQQGEQQPRVEVAINELEQFLMTGPAMQMVFGNPWFLERGEDETRFRLGFPGAATNQLIKPRGGFFAPTLAPLLEKKKVPVEQGVPDQELLRRFEAFGKRDAVLPTALAEQRKK